MARGASVIVKTDLSAALIVGESGMRPWAGDPMPTDRTPTVREVRARATGAALWIARDSEARRRIDAIYADVDDALCIWMRATSAARPVVASHLRTMAQEWGDGSSVLAVEPVRDDVPAPGKRSRKFRKDALTDDDGADTGAPEHKTETSGFTVIALPDATVRLLADSIDGEGVRIDSVSTVWHMLARAIASREEPGVSGIVVADTRSPRLIWVWADASGVRAAGCVRTGGESHEDSARRLALDWVTWAAQLGCCPDRVSVVGHHAPTWQGALGSVWDSVPIESDESDDPLSLLARRAAEFTPPTTSGRWCLSRVTRRPTRATRARYQLAGAAVVLVFVAVASIAFRLWQKSEQWKSEAAEARQQMVQAVRDTWPQKFAAQPVTSPRKVAETLFAEEIRDFKPFEPPPRPRPIFDEALRVATILASRITEPTTGVPSVLLTQLVLDQERGNALSFRVPDRQTATELIVELNGTGRLVDWQRTSQSADPAQPNLTGTWVKETE